jgi:hypothetical protein
MAEAGTGRQRLQLDFSAEAFQRLEDIRVMARANSKAEVVRNAIRLYDWYLTNVKQQGAKLQVIDGTSVRQVELVF